MSTPSSSSGPSAGIAVIPPQRRHVERNASVNPVARALLAGALLKSNKASPLRELARCVHILETIFDQVRTAWKDALVIGPSRDEECFSDGNWSPGYCDYFNRREVDALCGKLSLIQLSSVPFPPPRDVNVNMMPIILSSSIPLPDYLMPYHAMIQECIFPKDMNWYPQTYCERTDTEVNPVAYLTVHESRVEGNEPQRRGGIHTEGMLVSAPEPNWFEWGQFHGMVGGIFCASSVSKSARMWNARIPRAPSAVLREGCDIEHIRGVLDEAADWVEPGAGEMYWMTDATPHESLPLKPGTYRQFFRLVVGKIGGWYEKHSTKNPFGVQPDCPVIKHNKFVQEKKE